VGNNGREVEFRAECEDGASAKHCRLKTDLVSASLGRLG